MKRADRRGMTLIEVSAAIAIAGLVALGSLQLLQTVGDATHRIATDAVDLARSGLGPRLLAQLMRDVMATSDSSNRFRGDEQSLVAPARCPTAEGWDVPCSLTIAIDGGGDSSRIVATISGSGNLALRSVRGRAEFRYYDAAADSAWRRVWRTQSTLPLALAILTARDTTLIPIGPARE